MEEIIQRENRYRRQLEIARDEKVRQEEEVVQQQQMRIRIEEVRAKLLKDEEDPKGRQEQLQITEVGKQFI